MEQALDTRVSTSKRRDRAPEANGFPRAAQLYLFALPHALKQRYPWYIQTFNVANYSFAALAAWGAAHLVGRTAVGGPELRFALTGTAASVVWILVNHSALATMLRLARGTSYRESGL